MSPLRADSVLPQILLSHWCPLHFLFYLTFSPTLNLPHLLHLFLPFLLPSKLFLYPLYLTSLSSTFIFPKMCIFIIVSFCSFLVDHLFSFYLSFCLFQQKNSSNFHRFQFLHLYSTYSFSQIIRTECKQKTKLNSFIKENDLISYSPPISYLILENGRYNLIFFNP